MNELQKKEFELLKCLDEICKKINVSYYLVCGSALGAEKYQGFIPWDDDVDVGMYRQDYEQFLQLAPKYLPEEFFLQNYKTDPQFPQLYSKLRNSNTTYIEKSVEHLNINHGIYIDIFPLDGYPRKIFETYKLEIKKWFYKWQLACVYKGDYSLKSRILFGIERILGFHKKTQAIVEKLDKLISKYPCDKSRFICNHGNWQGKMEYAPVEQYGKGKMAVFEGLSVLIPENIDEYLMQKYGDWRAELPDEKQQGHHYYSICDLEKSYIFYK